MGRRGQASCAVGTPKLQSRWQTPTYLANLYVDFRGMSQGILAVSVALL
jgi:hypothetical protein